MSELGKVIERTEDDDKQCHHRDEGRVVPRVGFFEENEGGNKKRDGDASRSHADIDSIKINPHCGTDDREVTECNPDRVRDPRLRMQGRRGHLDRVLAAELLDLVIAATVAG